jgi:hypothetical protein
MHWCARTFSESGGRLLGSSRQVGLQSLKQGVFIEWFKFQWVCARTSARRIKFAVQHGFLWQCLQHVGLDDLGAKESGE